MKISVIGLGIYSLAISKALAKNKNNKIVIWTENPKKLEEFKETKKLISIVDTDIPKNISVTTSIKDAVEKAFSCAGDDENSVILAFGSLSFIGALTNAVEEYVG